jgi:hypothetical protein
MTIVQTPKVHGRTQEGRYVLGAVERSIGYLQGGYYTGSLPGTRLDGSTYPPDGQSRGAESAWQSIQTFNTITGAGRLVYDSGYARRYYAGVSGNHFGYYSINNNYDYQRYNFVTNSVSSSFSTDSGNNCTAVDLNVYTQSWIFEAQRGESTGTAVNAYIKVDLATDTPSNRGNLGSGPIGTSRQALNNNQAAYVGGAGGGSMYTLNYATQALVSQGTFAGMEQIFCGMSVTNSYGYVVGYKNVRVAMAGATMQSYSTRTAYTYLFGESHTLVSDVFGFMMAGYPDNTGRYSGTQHALCSRITLSTESIAIMNDILLPQSSGQMMQGF